jgi:hypothetical protein
VGVVLFDASASSQRPHAPAKAVVASNSGKTGPRAPKPGEGPTKHVREAGSHDLLLVAITPDGRSVRASVRGDRDPGDGSNDPMPYAFSRVIVVFKAPDGPIPEVVSSD